MMYKRLRCSELSSYHPLSFSLSLSVRCPTTRAKTLLLLCCCWARSVKSDVLELLHLLDLEYHEAVCAVVVKALSNVAANPGTHLDNIGPPERRVFMDRLERRASSSLETLRPLDAAAALVVRAICDACNEGAAYASSRTRPRCATRWRTHRHCTARASAPLCKQSSGRRRGRCPTCARRREVANVFWKRPSNR